MQFCIFVSHPKCYQIACTATIDAYIESIFRVGFAADFSVYHKLCIIGLYLDERNTVNVKLERDS